MPEGHSVHRIARQFDRNFVGRAVRASSPQGRFADGAAIIDGHTVTEVVASGKQMFLGFDIDLWLRVHLGMYGAWDFSGEILVDATIAASGGRMGQTNQRGTVIDADGEDSLTSIGAPRRARGHVRMGEETTGESEPAQWPPPPVGQVRLRLLTDRTCADLRGPTACELQTAEQMTATMARLGPDPLVGDPDEGERRFVAAAGRSRTPIALVLMDQSVIGGIGNVYRCELLFRARLNPHRSARDVGEAQLRSLWADWCTLLAAGVETGQMMTMDGLTPEQWRQAMAHREDRHWVYRRAGLPCRVCGSPVAAEQLGGRTLYWCPRCQA